MHPSCQTLGRTSHPMHIPVAIANFWKRFEADAGSVDPTRFYEAFHFGDNEEMANALADLP